jgi:hypothetical protein
MLTGLKVAAYGPDGPSFDAPSPSSPTSSCSIRVPQPPRGAPFSAWLSRRHGQSELMANRLKRESEGTPGPPCAGATSRACRARRRARLSVSILLPPAPSTEGGTAFPQRENPASAGLSEEPSSGLEPETLSLPWLAGPSPVLAVVSGIGSRDRVRPLPRLRGLPLLAAAAFHKFSIR